MILQCEFCESYPKWRFRYAGFGTGLYERYTCSEHIGWLRRLIAIDFYGRLVTFEFEPVEPERQAVAEDRCPTCENT